MSVGNVAITLGSRCPHHTPRKEGWKRTKVRFGESMSAESVIYYLKRPPAQDPVDETEWLFSALGQFTGGELRELLYIAQEPEFFETMRAVFAMPEHSRAALQEFLAEGDPRPVNAAIQSDGSCVLRRGAPKLPEKPQLKIVE
jgi:hypothetical protein